MQVAGFLNKKLQNKFLEIFTLHNIFHVIDQIKVKKYHCESGSVNSVKGCQVLINLIKHDVQVYAQYYYNVQHIKIKTLNVLHLFINNVQLIVLS